MNAPGAFVPPVERGIGMVFQDFALWPHMRVAKHLDFVLRGRGLPRHARALRAGAMLELLHLRDRRGAYPGELSGGEAQRLAIARALITEPRILLLDEPFANIDAELRQDIMDEVLRRKHSHRAAILLATHNADEAELLGDRLFRMQNGAR